MADRGYRGRPQRGERADRQINAGHSRGLDVALARTEARIRNLKEERIYAFDENGKELAHSTTGTSKNTFLPRGNYKDAILTHNHPQAWMNGKGLGERVGTTFSADDLILAAVNNAKEIRAVTRGGYTFSIKRPKTGWKISKEDTPTIRKKYEEKTLRTYQKYNKAKGDRGERQYRESETRFKYPFDDKYETQFYERNNINSFHQAMKELSKEYGFGYTRKRTHS